MLVLAVLTVRVLLLLSENMNAKRRQERKSEKTYFTRLLRRLDGGMPKRKILIKSLYEGAAPPVAACDLLVADTSYSSYPDHCATWVTVAAWLRVLREVSC